MKLKLKPAFLLVLLSALFCYTSTAQTFPQGITYQGLARNSSNAVLVNQAISIKLGIYTPTVTGSLEWEETHTITTNQLGLFYFIIGQGTSTGAGAKASFSLINWGTSAHFIKIAMDENGGSSYVNIDTVQFWSVPYAMYSGSSGSVNQLLRLHQLSDVDTLGVASGYVLKWNGSLWLPAADNDSDTALYAFNANHAKTSDTATYALNVLSTVDTVSFSYNSDTSSFALNSNTSANSLNSDYCDTAAYALNTGANPYIYWNLAGNTGISPATNFIGTINNADFILKTNNQERMRITSAGRIGIGTAAPTASVHIIGNDGVVAIGTFGTGALPPSGVGTRMVWHPKKAAFRAGGVASNQWDNANIGNYSFAANFNTVASGAYSTAFGSYSTASGQNSLAVGDASVASGFSSVSMGSVCLASGPYSVAIGRSPDATDSGSVAIGYHNAATGKFALSFGYQTVASGDYSTVFGYYANSNNKKGSFVYADQSSTTVTNSTADNQFLVRASGGYLLYSNTALTSGVSLPAGGGSWASVSDKNKKEHFKKENANDLLNKLVSLEISSWNYKSQPTSIRHMGPMAQDFYKAFHLGESDTTITTIDIDGVSLIAIQALAQKTKELKLKADEVETLKAQVEKLEKEKKALEKRVMGIEQKLNITSPNYTVSNKN